MDYNQRLSLHKGASSIIRSQQLRVTQRKACGQPLGQVSPQATFFSFIFYRSEQCVAFQKSHICKRRYIRMRIRNEIPSFMRKN